jgi:ribA/ribD-fused uncharacterized protein
MRTIIDDFRGPHYFLSNFYPAPVALDRAYPTNEHAFHAYKTLVQAERDAIAAAPLPGDAKRLGRRCTMRPGWESLRVAVMEGILWAKFTQHEELCQRLLATGDAELTEGNTWNDTYWGCVWQDERWVGENHLGRLLMLTRRDLVDAGINTYFQKMSGLR